MRTRSFLLLAAVLLALVVRAQSSGQFVITLMDGRTYVRMLPPDWSPRFEGPFLYFTPRDRVFVADVAAVQPVLPDNIADMRSVKLLFRSHLGRGSQIFWVPTQFRRVEDAPQYEGFLRIGPQTLIRPGIYREALE
jgi:hypothetical protein